jgi:hypothetical protein
MRCKRSTGGTDRCEISDDGARTTIRCADRRLVRTRLDEDLQMPSGSGDVQQRYDRVTGRQRQALRRR